MKANPATPAPSSRPNSSLTLALLYAAFAGMWILFSDQILVWLFEDSADYAMASTFKGLFFVVVTTLLLYGLMRRFEAGADAAPLGKRVRWASLLIAILVVGFTAVAMRHALMRGDGLAVAAWIGGAGLLTLTAFGAAMLILHQRAQLQLALALRESEARLHLLIDHAPIALALFDRDMRYLALSRRWREDFEIGERDVIGQSHYAIFPDLRETWKAAHRRGLAGEVVQSEGEPFERQDGRVIWTRWEVQPWLDGDGKVGGIVIFTEDISARKQADMALQRLTDDLAATLRAIPDLLFEVDESGRYLKVKATARHLLAAPTDRLLGHTIGEMLPSEAAATVMDALASAARNGSDYGRTITLPLPAGPHHFELSVARKSVDPGAGAHFIVLSRDITQRKAAEEELRRNNEELQRFNHATVGRELDMVELKKQVNALARELGRAAPYPLDFLQHDAKP